MGEVDAISKIYEFFDGFSAVVLAVWFINVLMREHREDREQNERLVDRVDDTNKELLRMIRDGVNQPRHYSLPSTQPRPVEFEKHAGL